MMVYIVKGTTGDYEDTYHWNAKAYTDKEKAEQFCEKLNEIAKRGQAYNFGKTYAERDFSLMHQVQEEVVEELNKLDPGATMSGSGTFYRIEELEVDT